MSTVTRRGFVPGAAAAFTIVPRHVLGGAGFKAPSDTLNIAGVGVGGMGGVYLRNCETENIVALADVDDEVAARTFERYPKATRYRDFRKLLENEKGIDAVVIGTPDHTHAVVAMSAMKRGKHVYCAKPLTRTIYEARTLARTAREQKVATQMSVQSCASEESCATAEWVESGAIGSVREVHVWSDRPIWPQAVLRPTESAAVPSTLDWDLWLGPAPLRPYHPVYHPFVWRGWWDFGTGAIGDMACHTLHVIFRALNLGYPTKAQASSAHLVRIGIDPAATRINKKSKVQPTPETLPAGSIITWDFPVRGVLPAVRVTWYDGGLKPPKPPEMDADKKLDEDGIIFIGDKGTILSGFTGGPRLVPESKNASFTPPPKTHERSSGHYQEWIAACKGGPPAKCNFDFGSLLAEVALLGNLAVRMDGELYWSPEDMRITNNAAANQYVNPPYRTGWSL